MSLRLHEGFSLAFVLCVLSISNAHAGGEPYPPDSGGSEESYLQSEKAVLSKTLEKYFSEQNSSTVLSNLILIRDRVVISRPDLHIRFEKLFRDLQDQISVDTDESESSELTSEYLSLYEAAADLRSEMSETAPPYDGGLTREASRVGHAIDRFLSKNHHTMTTAAFQILDLQRWMLTQASGHGLIVPE